MFSKKDLTLSENGRIYAGIYEDIQGIWILLQDTVYLKK